MKSLDDVELEHAKRMYEDIVSLLDIERQKDIEASPERLKELRYCIYEFEHERYKSKRRKLKAIGDKKALDELELEYAKKMYEDIVRITSLLRTNDN